MNEMPKTMDEARADFDRRHPNFTTGGTAPVSAELMRDVELMEQGNDQAKRLDDMDRRLRVLEKAFDRLLEGLRLEGEGRAGVAGAK